MRALFVRSARHGLRIHDAMNKATNRRRVNSRSFVRLVADGKSVVITSVALFYDSNCVELLKCVLRVAASSAFGGALSATLLYSPSQIARVKARRLLFVHIYYNISFRAASSALQQNNVFIKRRHKPHFCSIPLEICMEPVMFTAALLACFHHEDTANSLA
jgi:hypothetical protein